jgi:hypothetical protein
MADEGRAMMGKTGGGLSRFSDTPKKERKRDKRRRKKEDGGGADA